MKHYQTISLKEEKFSFNDFTYFIPHKKIRIDLRFFLRLRLTKIKSFQIRNQKLCCHLKNTPKSQYISKDVHDLYIKRCVIQNENRSFREFYYFRTYEEIQILFHTFDSHSILLMAYCNNISIQIFVLYLSRQNSHCAHSQFNQGDQTDFDD